ncbi:MAG: hypothetical protein AAGC77_11900, partial [Pseudomonadota bacterium]
LSRARGWHTQVYNNFSSINTMASIIGGFSFSGLVIGTTYTGFFVDESETECPVRRKNIKRTIRSP